MPRPSARRRSSPRSREATRRARRPCMPAPAPSWIPPPPSPPPGASPCRPSCGRRCPATDRQALLGTWSEKTGKGFALCLDADGALALRLDGRTLGTGVPLANRHWYLVAGSYDADRGRARVVQIPCAGHRFHPFATAAREASMRAPEPGPGPFLIAAWHAGDTTGGSARCSCLPRALRRQDRAPAPLVRRARRRAHRSARRP